jgi:RNA-directed DNA polymerase
MIKMACEQSADFHESLDPFAPAACNVSWAGEQTSLNWFDTARELTERWETKTRVCKLPEEKFDFPGYTFGRCNSPKTGRAYIGTVPSKKRVIRICETISEMTGRDQTLLDQEMVVGKLNRTMIGWANYFCLGPVSKAYWAVEKHAGKRLRQWLGAKRKMWWPGTKRFPEGSLHEGLGLVCLTKRTSNFPWATP